MDPSGDIDLNLLRVFEALARERSVTAAARSLGLSQPAVSNALARLRRHFGDALFVRTPTGMQPTPLANELAAPIGEALALIGSTLVRDRGFDPAVSDRAFRFYMSDIGEMVFLPPLLEHLRDHAPSVRIEARQMDESALPEALLAGEIDLAVGFLPGLAPRLRSAPLFRDPYVALVRRDHPRIGRTLGRREFAEASHALVESAGSGHRVIEEALQANRLTRRVVLRMPHFTVVPMILERTDLVVSIPSRVARIFEGLGKFRALPLPVHVQEADVRVYWHERYEHDPGSRWLRALMVDLHGDAEGSVRRPRERARPRA